MYGCDRLLGSARAYEIRGLIEDATGASCPCKTGLTCPIGIREPEPLAVEFISRVTAAISGGYTGQADAVA